MKSFLRSLLAGLLAVALTGPVAVAQERPTFSDEELDQMLAPIALYPDSLLSQILMASTYPLEVVQAARWSRANSQLKGDDAVKAVEGMDWDPSVKSLVAFPQILHRMDERLDWTQRLGEAFLAQEPHVLAAIQGLRQRAAAAGNLNSNEHLRVTRQDEAILIDPVRPEAVYVPYYNPAVVYGPWAWTGYPPVYWAPFPGYYAAPGFAPAFFWGPAIVVSTGFFFGHCNWHHRHVTVVSKTVVTQTRFGKPVTTVTPLSKPVAWQHNPAHRKGVPYRHASLNSRFGMTRGTDSAPGMQDRNGGREGGPGRLSTQGGSKSAAPAAPNPQRSNSGSAGSRFQARMSAVQPAPAAPAEGLQVRGPSQATPAPAAPTRQIQRSESNGNNAHRFQGRMSAPQPTAAAPQANAQRQQQVRPPQAAAHGERGHAARQVAIPQRSVPPPQARAGHSAPRLASGNSSFRGGGGGGVGNGGRGGG